MTLSTDLAIVAASLLQRIPDDQRQATSAKLLALSRDAARLERTLDELHAQAAEEARLAEEGRRVVPLRRVVPVFVVGDGA